jgi:hypothetical protein
MLQPEFMIIGAQKAGTTWLWDKLRKHPGASLPQKKEIHYFGGVENYRRGEDWYLAHFDGLNPHKVIGEASTTYFYDYIPFWYNASEDLLIDETLPPIAELITRNFPDIKVVLSLRDPVKRAISAYSHWMKQGKHHPLAGLKATAIKHPKLRIVEYGYYARYLEMWRRYVPANRLFIVIFEEDIVDRPQETLKQLFRFLGLDEDIKLEEVDQIVHKSWSWNRIVLEYYASPLTKLLGGRLSNQLARMLSFFNLSPFNTSDLEFLRAAYLPEKEQIEQLTGRCLDCWSYGQNKLAGKKL